MNNWLEDRLRKRFQGKVVDGTVELGEKKHVIDLALKTYVEGGKVSGVSKEGKKGKDGQKVPVVEGWDEMDKVFKRRALVKYVSGDVYHAYDINSFVVCSLWGMGRLICFYFSLAVFGHLFLLATIPRLAISVYVNLQNYILPWSILSSISVQKLTFKMME